MYFFPAPAPFRSLRTSSFMKALGVCLTSMLTLFHSPADTFGYSMPPITIKQINSHKLLGGGAVNWRERMRSLWVERMVWIRHYIISLMMGLRDFSFVFNRALRNGEEIAGLLSQFYGGEIANQVENILTQHLLILSELATAVKAGNDITPMLPMWEGNKQAILGQIVSYNPDADTEAWEKILNDQFNIEMSFLMHLKQGDYETGIADFDLAHYNALRTARTMIEGLEKQFNV